MSGKLRTGSSCTFQTGQRVPNASAKLQVSSCSIFPSASLQLIIQQLLLGRCTEHLASQRAAHPHEVTDLLKTCPKVNWLHRLETGRGECREPQPFEFSPNHAT